MRPPTTRRRPPPPPRPIRPRRPPTPRPPTRMAAPRAEAGMAIRFSKMHGAGNDFVVLDLRAGQPAPDAALARAMGDRHTGVGYDQLLTIETSPRADCLARYRIWN